MTVVAGGGSAAGTPPHRTANADRAIQVRFRMAAPRKKEGRRNPGDSIRAPGRSQVNRAWVAVVRSATLTGSQDGGRRGRHPLEEIGDWLRRVGKPDCREAFRYSTASPADGGPRERTAPPGQ